VADDPLVTKALNRISDGEKAHTDRCRGYDRSYDVYRATAKARGPVNAPRKRPWESDIRVRYAQQVVDTAMVNLIGGQPRAIVKPRLPENTDAAKPMQILLDYHIGEDHLSEKQVPFTQQGLIYGLTAAKVHWLYRETDRKTRYFETDPYTGAHLVDDRGGFVQRQRTDTIVVRDGPTFEVWDVYDFWYEPNARDMDTADYVVFRSFLSAEELRALERKEGNPFGVYQNVEQCISAGRTGADRDSAQERFIGGSINRRKDRHELLEIWTDDEVMVIGNRSVPMRYEDNPYDHGRKPVVAASVRPDLFEVQGMSETELLDDLQQAAWSVQNMRFDNMHLTVQRGFTYRESGIIDPSALEIRPRFKWGVTDHDDVRMVDIQPLPSEAYREEDNLLSRMQLITGINPYVSGADLSTVDQNTATGVTALQEVASRLLRFKARQLAFSGYQRAFEMWIELVKQYTTQTQAIRLALPDGGYAWEHIEPWSIAGNFDVTVEGTEESLSRQQERAEALGLLNAFGPFAAVPGINMGPVFDRVARSFDMPEGVLYNPPPPQQQGPPASPQGAPPQNGQPPPGVMAGLGQQPSQPGPSLYGPQGQPEAAGP